METEPSQAYNTECFPHTSIFASVYFICISFSFGDIAIMKLKIPTLPTIMVIIISIFERGEKSAERLPPPEEPTDKPTVEKAETTSKSI